MVLQPCPECAASISSQAAACPHCGCPVASTPLPAKHSKAKARARPAGHIGTIPGCLLILLAGMGITYGYSVRMEDPMNRPPPSDQRQPRKASSMTTEKPTPVTFDPSLAARGRELHARLIEEAGVHGSYRVGTLFGAVTSKPRAAIAVPLDAWKALSVGEQAELMNYAASLVEPMRVDPLAYCKIPSSAPAASIARKNAHAMGPRSWVIHGGRIDGQDILTDEAVASGEESSLSAH